MFRFSGCFELHVSLQRGALASISTLAVNLRAKKDSVISNFSMYHGAKLLVCIYGGVLCQMVGVCFILVRNCAWTVALPQTILPSEGSALQQTCSNL
mmetsp:Transcript_44816/g.173921  ORF Transcript_44816/g.173921 Transcript_44816/m.173921 type:complete len:97 (-) Transcript_44816:2032-2322(-)